MEINLGKYNTLRVVKEVDFGMYLDGGIEGEILLPKRYVPQGCKPGDDLEVFIYLDQDERLVATLRNLMRRWAISPAWRCRGSINMALFSTGD